MLSTATTFPHAGSTALLDDRFWRILRTNADGTATIYDADTKASGTRTVPLADLTDPESPQARHPDAPLAVRLALAFREMDAVPNAMLMDRAQIIIAQHNIPMRASPKYLGHIMRALGWRFCRRSRGQSVWLRKATQQEAA
ncbi:MAG: hypothetical protein E2598_07625 [Sphingobium sp.]|nr:hypothetical protein [Sphingobium sp.]